MDKQKFSQTGRPSGQSIDLDSRNPMHIPSNLPTNNKVSLKFDTFLWISASGATLYYSEIINVLRTHSLTNGTPFVLAMLLGGLSVTIAMYLILWCSYIQGLSADDWETYNPYAIPAATACGVGSGLCWNVALWEVYGIKTPLIILILCMGMVMIISLLPSWSPVERKNSTLADNSSWMKAHGKMD